MCGTAAGQPPNMSRRAASWADELECRRERRRPESGVCASELLHVVNSETGTSGGGAANKRKGGGFTKITGKLHLSVHALVLHVYAVLGPLHSCPSAGLLAGPWSLHMVEPTT